jgi:hypothetical protein
MKSIRENFWQIISIVLALVAIFATYNVYFLTKTTKEIQVVVSPPVSLVDIKPDAPQDLEVLYRGEKVNNVLFIKVQIENNGNQPIAESDYSSQLAFSVSKDCKFANIEVASTNPPDLGISFDKVSEQEAQASATLFNSGDSAEIHFIIIAGDTTTVKNCGFWVDGRILGTRIERIYYIDQTPEEAKQVGLLQRYIIIIASSIALIAGISFYRSFFKPKKKLPKEEVA